MPFFSVVIPVYNRSGLLQKTLDTIFAQTFGDFEIVVVDDGSTDNTATLIRDLMTLRPQLRYVFQENSERGRARNTGIRQAAGKYAVLFDSDDLMHAGHLQTLYDGIHRTNFPDFIATKFDFVHDGRRRSSDLAALKEGYYDYRLFLRGNPLACNICIRNPLPGIHPFEEDRRYAMLEDWMFYLQNLVTRKVYLIDQVTVSMFDHDERSMKGDNSMLVKKAALALEWMKSHLPLPAEEFRQLEAQVCYFSAIHCYLDGKRSETFRFLARATKTGGFRTAYASLFLKAAAGRKRLLALKH